MQHYFAEAEGKNGRSSCLKLPSQFLGLSALNTEGHFENGALEVLLKLWKHLQQIGWIKV